MTEASRNNRLAALAADIRSCHADIEQGAMQIAERVFAAGNALVEAKAAVPHGQWIPWLSANTGLSARTARRYMQIVESGIEVATVANLGLKAATASLARVVQPPNASEAQEAWQTELITTLDAAEEACPGFRAGFVTWAKTRHTADTYADALRRDCPDDELPALNAIIEAEQNRTLILAIRRAHVAGDHA